MITVQKDLKDNILTVKMAGSIEESVNFDELIGATPAEMHIYTKDVPRINSVGVKAWIKFFQAASSKGTKLKFFECSTAIVEQINLISNFLCGGSVESIYVPFSCNGCRAELIGLFKTSDLKKLNGEVPSMKCSKCNNGTAEFDDIPEEYFGFLSR